MLIRARFPGFIALRRAKGTRVFVARGEATASWEEGQWIVIAQDVKALTIEVR